MAAIQEDPGAIGYVEDPTPEMLAAAEQNISEPPVYEDVEPDPSVLELMDEMNRMEFEQDDPEFTDIGVEQMNDIGDVARITEDISSGLGNLQNDEPEPFER